MAGYIEEINKIKDVASINNFSVKTLETKTGKILAAIGLREFSTDTVYIHILTIEPQKGHIQDLRNCLDQLEESIKKNNGGD